MKLANFVTADGVKLSLRAAAATPLDIDNCKENEYFYLLHNLLYSLVFLLEVKLVKCLTVYIEETVYAELILNTAQ